MCSLSFIPPPQKKIEKLWVRTWDVKSLGWMYLAPDSNQWRAVVITALNLQVFICEDFLDWLRTG